MKKVLLTSLIALSAITLIGCESLSGPTTMTDTIIELTTEQQLCADAITQRKEMDRPLQDTLIKKGDAITVDYIGRLNDHTVFDTSVESVAKACEKHTMGRDYSGGLGFTVGAGQMIAGFDAGVLGKKVGETFTINIPAAQAYGERDEKAFQIVLVADLPAQEDGKEYEVGDTLYDMRGQGFPITKIEDKKATLDVNHELAGKELIFDIHIREVK